MKGMIFTEFMEMVEETQGLEVLDQIIQRAHLSTQGSYTAVGNYDYNELVRLVVELSKLSKVSVPELLHAFGRHVFGRIFVKSYGSFFENARSAFMFLEGIETYIHIEVRKLYPDAQLPRFNCRRQGNNRLIMEYSSVRPFADFAHGLIIGCIDHYKEDIEVIKEDTSNGQGTAARFTLTMKGNGG